MERGVDVTHKLVESPVTFFSPLGDEAGKPACCPQQIESSHSCRVKDLHQDARRVGLQQTSGSIVSRVCQLLLLRGLP